MIKNFYLTIMSVYHKKVKSFVQETENKNSPFFFNAERLICNVGCRYIKLSFGAQHN